MTTRWHKPVSRILPVRDNRTGRQWVITIDGPMVRLRLKGLRSGYAVPVVLVANLGARIRAQELKQEKLERRKARKAAHV